MVAMAASMFLIVASWNTEWDATAAEPKTADKANEEENPGKGTSGLVDVSDSNFATVIASHLDWMVWPVMWITSGATCCGRSCDICDWLRLWRHRILLRRRLHSRLSILLLWLLGHLILWLIWRHHLLLLHWNLRLHLVCIWIRCVGLNWCTICSIVLHERCLFTFVHLYILVYSFVGHFIHYISHIQPK